MKVGQVLKFRPNVANSAQTEQGSLALVSEAEGLKFVYTFEGLSIGKIISSATHEALVDSISTIKLIPELLLYNGDPFCLVILVLASDQFEWPPLVMEPLPRSRPDSVEEILYLLRRWLRPHNRDLVMVERNCFCISDQLQGLDERSDHSDMEVSLERIKNFSLGVVSSILGTPTAHKLEDVGVDVLERFAKVTTFAKEKTTQALEHPLTRPLLPYIPEQIRVHFLSSQEAQELLKDYVSAEHYFMTYAKSFQSSIGRKSEDQGYVNDTKFDYENQSEMYTAHYTGSPLTTELWNSWHEDGKLTVDPKLVKCTIFCGGIEPGLRNTVWPYLLNHNVVITNQSNLKVIGDKRQNYYDMRQSWMEVLQDAGRSSPTRLDAPQTGSVGDENENSDVISKLVERRYRIDKDVARTDQSIPFFKMEHEKENLREAIDSQPNLTKLRNICMTYTVYNFELGYVQGMNDLAAPLLHTIEDEADTFWAFVAFMERMKQNFHRDQKGMRDQLAQLEILLKVIDPPLHQHLTLTDSINMFCCFRWLLILFKREFEFEDIKTLWEVIWSCPFSTQYHLFISIAILNLHRQEIFKLNAFDEVLKYVNNLSMRIMIPEVLQHAEVLFYIFRDFLISTGSDLLRDGITQAVAANSVEALLVQASGMNTEKIYLDHKLDRPLLTEQEWLQVIQVFEVHQEQSR